MEKIAANLAIVKERIARAARDSGREPGDVTLVAVSKNQPDESVRAALDAGQRIFGENRVQEAQKRWEGLRATRTCPDLRLHLIGPLQTNKVRIALALFDVIETLDRPELAQALAEAQARMGHKIPCLIQVNTGEEPQKHGVKPGDLAGFVTLCRQTLGLEIRGLMCIPPADEPPALHFAFLAKLARSHGLRELSMGMSADYEKAIALGATCVRVGTSIFGSRDMPAPQPCAGDREEG